MKKTRILGAAEYLFSPAQDQPSLCGLQLADWAARGALPLFPLLPPTFSDPTLPTWWKLPSSPNQHQSSVTNTKANVQNESDFCSTTMDKFVSGAIL